MQLSSNAMSYVFKKCILLKTMLHPSPTSDFPHIYFANAMQKKRGALIAIKDTVHFKPLDVTLDDQDRFILLVCDIDNTIVNIYAPNSRQI